MFGSKSFLVPLVLNLRTNLDWVICDTTNCKASLEKGVTRYFFSSLFQQTLKKTKLSGRHDTRLLKYFFIHWFDERT